MKSFDVITAPLTSGTCCLIEANAGTGKTYNIQHLYLRLLLNEKVEPAKILVVTFTEAATAELKERIRNNIIAALEWLEHDKGSDKTLKYDQDNDETLVKIIEQAVGDKEQKQGYINHLRLALAAFDEAAIHTIHGFCKRTLERHAFESKVRFDAELQPSFTDLAQEVVRDFYRRELEEHGIPILSLSELSNYALVRLDHVGNLQLYPLAEQNNIEKLWSDFWSLVDNTELPSRDTKFKAALAMVKQYTSEERLKRRNEVLREKGLLATKAQKYLPLVKKLEDILAASGVDLLYKLFAYLDDPKQGFEARKASMQVMGYDDLLKKMLAALPDSECDLAKELRQNYFAAMVDEFQDTDPVQYQIFATVFKHPESILYMIGDPKQAIYGFRGGDIYTYLAARLGIKDQFTLTQNFRSAARLLDAINLLFSPANSFLEEELDYTPSKSGREPVRILRKDDHPLQPPMYLHWFASKDDQGSVKSDLLKGVERYCCEKIMDLLQDNTLSFVDSESKKQSVKPQDIAVLVNTNYEARNMKQALLQYGIPAIVYRADNIFASREAREIRLLLRAMYKPSDGGRVKSALITPWCGYTTAQTVEMEGDAAKIQPLIKNFVELHQSWVQQGIMQALSELQRCFNSASVIGRDQECERHMTNFRHIAEILHQQEQFADTTPTQLLQWFEKQLTNPDNSNTELEERLESDRRAVTIMTIHKSKGLEFPIVFVPWMFLHNNKKLSGNKKPWTVHIPDNNSATDGAKKNKVALPLLKAAQKEFEVNRICENLSESLRQLYVALTRAENACHLFMGNVKDGYTTSPINYLYQLLKNANVDIDNFIKGELLPGNLPHLPDRFNSLITTIPVTYSVLCQPGSIRQYQAMEELPVITAPPKPPHVSTAWGVMSYSSLTQHGIPQPGYMNEGRGDDEIITEPVVLLEEDPLPGGKGVGLSLHAIFEELPDFTLTSSNEETSLYKLCTNAGVRHGLFNREALDISDSEAVIQCQRLTEIVRDTLKAHLPDCQTSFQLQQLAKEDCRKEWEFYLHVAVPIDLSVFRALGLTFKQQDERGSSGFLTGSIDLLFRRGARYYFLDWKSDKLANYHPDTLQQEMRERNYLFQAIVYSIALYLLLKKNLGNQYNHTKHFGGGYYCFIRGMQDQNGVYHLTPTETQLQEWCNQLGILATSKL